MRRGYLTKLRIVIEGTIHVCIFWRRYEQATKINNLIFVGDLLIEDR